ncbi:hypothetical protein BN961_01571 [Afipia felis]|uniref:Uncharacterized protein n=1 Tax=Afipia felis TaxID=1035 RepID=A0A090MPG6_AFIFE|nr:hypothetical protein BN961_01571 [Afipia felis]
MLAELDAGQQRAVCHAGCSKQAVALHHVLNAIDHAGILDPHLGSALALLVGIEDQATLHLAADAAQRRRSQHAFRRATGADVNIDAGVLRIGSVDHTGVVAVGDEAHRGTGRTHGVDDVGMARTVEDQCGDRRGMHVLGAGETADVLGRRRVEVDHVLGVTGPHSDLLHINVGRIEKRAAFGHRHGGDRTRHALGAQRRTFQRIDRDVDFRPELGADLLTDEQHRGFVALALADHDRALDWNLVQLAAHRIDRCLIGGLLVAMSAQARRRHRGTLRHAHDFQCQDALKQELRRDGNGRHQ